MGNESHPQLILLKIFFKKYTSSRVLNTDFCSLYRQWGLSLDPGKELPVVALEVYNLSPPKAR